MFLFNIGDAIEGIPARSYSNRNHLLTDLFWLTTCMSCLIFSKKLISNANFERYISTSFVQTGVIYEYISDKPFEILWEPTLSLVPWSNFNGARKISWQSNILEVWFQKRINLIFSLPPSYDLEAKLKIAKEVHIHDRLSAMHLVSYRSSGVLNLTSYKRFKYIFSMVASRPRIYAVSYTHLTLPTKRIV